MSSSSSEEQEQQQQHEHLYFNGVKCGIKFATEWTKLFYSVQKWKNKIIGFESELQNPATQVRLVPQILSICHQMKIEYEELEYLLDDNEGVNRETEFESIQYKLTVFKKELKCLKNMHKEREKAVGIKGKRIRLASGSE
jgi:hypothetical protein